ncbi:hypothetical protein AVEN_136626-1 [Araneus ventricosus]|uniref:Uncharacterized protein n=1 Tax=Araneus ventricosus TaxID=182803 RepID=A0A4Y2CA60_ARAVE|nr:hypothetical protein AVEN_136626-1 [Araneus ventricosus]
MIGSGGIPTNSKFKTSSADCNLGPRCESSAKTKNLPTLGPRVEARNETRNPPCSGRGMWVGRILRLGTLSQNNFGASVNVLPNFSTKMSGIQITC